MLPLALLLLVVSLTSLPAGSMTQAAPTSSMPAPAGAILVELFTSEGCSDCPPADALLRQVSGTHLAEGPAIIVLSEHVTYWDELGWKDAFSDPVYTARQNAYGQRFNLDSVYTPQMVVNGTQQFVGGNGKALLDALHAEAHSQRVALQILSIEPDAGADRTALTIRFSAQNVPAGAALDLMAAVTDDLDETRVLRGENGGRTLTHASVVRFLARVGEVRGNTTETTVRVALPASLKQLPDKPRHLVLFVQQHNFGRVSGVDTKPLGPPIRP